MRINWFSVQSINKISFSNTKNDINILELLEEMKENIPQDQWENILKKSIKRTKIQHKDEAFNDLMELLE